MKLSEYIASIKSRPGMQNMPEQVLYSQLSIRMHMAFQYVTHQNERYSYLEGALKALEGGCRWIQLRMKDATDEEFKQVALPLSKACEEHDALFLLDDRVHLVKEVGAQGVHLGKDDMTPSEARQILGNNYIIGGTANSIEDIERLAEEDVTYIGCGPFRFTTTKKKLAPVLGIEGYKKLYQQMEERLLNIPFVAIGGVTHDDIEQLMLDGHANGVAVSGAILNAEDPVEMTRKMLKKTRETYFYSLGIDSLD